MAEIMKPLNITIEIAGIVICALGILLVGFGSKIDKKASRYFLALFGCLILCALSNIAGQLMRGIPGPGWRTTLYVVNFGEFFFSFCLTYIVTLYLFSILDPEHQRKGAQIAVTLILGIEIVLLVVSQFTGLCYSFDERNVYHRGKLYPLFLFLNALMMVFDMYFLVREREHLSRRERIAFWLYLLIPLCAIAIQAFVYGIYIVIFSLIISALAMFVIILAEQIDRFHRQESELNEARTAIMLSQIRPHFLYNTLDSIYLLCETDPAEAQKALKSFSLYLQGNMSSLDSETAIPFEAEMRHVESYLSLEKLSLEEKLTYEFDFQASGFRVPVLSVQPIVENAVKHGIAATERGGTVRVFSYETPDAYFIKVVDNGAGFDVKAPRRDGKKHIGIENVRSRLADICGGTLEIESEPGNGTTVTLMLPKERNSYDDFCNR